ncbi:Ger(x)C family spore germination protein [Paenibacillus piri]|uniref:Ger(X)C family spore germination protein n=1 Tax=Paenibacillus piri TaxID=2547395 RepID=A0A4R5KYN6_9BACL|nr:Ger(x)C family spore germination protein [Paenibacillus piri]TDG00181.1 Ger(x)C family spore germination protein [Paenibacillus piri]
MVINMGNSHKSKNVRLLLPVCCLLLLTGCWSRIEVNDRAFVTGMYIDRLDNGDYEVSLGFPLANRLATGGHSNTTDGGGGGGNPFALVSKKAENIPVAIRKIRSDLTREISWGHCRIVIVGRKMAESGIGAVLEFISREPTFHIKSYIMVAPGQGKSISELTPVFERMPAEVLREFAKRRVTIDTSIKDFLESAASGGDMVTALLTIGQEKMVSEKGKMSTWVGTDGAAVFKKDKMVGTFDVKDMRAVLWVKGKMKSSLISLKSPTDGKIISFLILNSKTVIKPVKDQGKIRFDIKIEAEDDIVSSESNIDLTEPEEILRIEEMLSKQLTGRVNHVIKKSQKMGADIFGFGQYIDWNFPKIWDTYKDRWPSEYKNVKFNVEAKILVRRTGVEKNPIMQKHQ